MDALRRMLKNRQAGMRYAGIPSFCTANGLVIEACLKQAIRFDDCVLIKQRQIRSISLAVIPE